MSAPCWMSQARRRRLRGARIHTTDRAPGFSGTSSFFSSSWHIALVLAIIVLSLGPFQSLGFRDVLGRNEAHAEQEDLSADDAGLQMLQAMCQEAAAAAAEQEQAGSVAAGGTIHVGKGPAGASLGDCHSKIFHPVTGLRCKHIYRHTVKGVAGLFSDAHVQALRDCVPGGLAHVEEDGKVHKAEGPSPGADDSYTSSNMHRIYSKPSGRTLKTPAPPLRSQQQQQQQVFTDGSADSVPFERQQDLLDALGRAAKQHLSTMRARLWGFRRMSGRGGPAVDPGSTVLEAEGPAENSSGGGGGGEVSNTTNSSTVSSYGMTDPAAGGGGGGATVSLPNPPEMPTAPAALPGNQPGPSQPVDPTTLAALATIEDTPTTKVERLPPALWNLDRIDQVDPPLDRQYFYGAPGAVGTGHGVTIYALDSGTTPGHQEFLRWDGSGSRASYGWDFVDGDATAADCDGHGTHVGATAIGRGVGVAKSATLVAVRVLDCSGSGTISDTVAGIEWVAQHRQLPAVAIMSLGVSSGDWSATLEASTRSLINDIGIPAVVASGNSGKDACQVVPANLPETLTVAATNMAGKFDAQSPGGTETMYRWANTGACIDVFAPGVEIWSACGSTSRCPSVAPDAYTWASGTSMAVPHVAGLAAIYLGDHPGAKPSEVSNAIVGSALTGKIQDGRLLPGTPNRVLYTRGAAFVSTTPVVTASSGNHSSGP